MSKSGRVNKGRQVFFRGKGSSSGLVCGGVYTLVRSLLQDGVCQYKVRDKTGNVYTAPDLFFSFV